MGWAHIALVLVICMEITSTGASYNVSTDESALLAIKNRITSDPNNLLLNNWTQATPFCNWYGVTCGTRHTTRVTSLRLLSAGLSGTIAKEIGNLSFLVFLEIGNNSFQGDVPEEIGLLRRLRHLSLQYNELTGPIPQSFGSLSRLQLLDLSNNNLVGTIPFPIFNISSLRIIDFSENQLQGTLPMDICGNLPRLQGLSASRNQLGGELPSLNKCTQALYISLSRNQFTGSVPKEIGNFSVLQELYLGWNNLTGSLPEEIGNAPVLQILSLRQNSLVGIIPPSLGNLSNLEMIDLGVNNFHGSIPSELGHLSNLQQLYLSFDNLTGEIPVSIYNISTLQVLALTGNSLSGSLPTDMAVRLPNLRGVFLGSNQLTGPIPSSISNGSVLSAIDLGYNLFSGNIPMTLGNLLRLQTIILEGNQLTSDPDKPELEFLTSLTNCPSLNTIQIGYNPLDGVLPKSFMSSGNLSASLGKFHASGCGLKGVIPTEIGNFSNLYWLSLAKNNLTGKFPDTIGNLRILQRFRANENGIQGGMPSGLCSLEGLFELNLSKNKLSGELPSCLGNISSLREIYLDSNALTSSLPSSFWGNKDVLIVNLSSNFLYGVLGQEIGSVAGLRELYLAGNNFSGEIPNSIGGLQELVNLSLSMNMLDGSIPEKFGDLVSLEYLDLSHNRISGVIPTSMEKLRHLVYLNLSFNDLSGEIPNGGPFQNFSPASFIGNNALCGASRFNVMACKTIESRKPRKNRVLKYVLPLCGLLVLIIGLTWVLIRKKGNRSQIESGIELRPRFSYLEILKATEDFDAGNLLGSGSFGKVYKGTFLNGTVAAIKVFNLDVRDALKSFDTECEAMRSIRHRNLVKVISSCSNADFKAIIFEYMPKGSLEKWLYSEDNLLDMNQRLGIMIDVASALEYLHHGYSSPMVHCDLKPSNILFDENMVARLSDFGIAKLLGGEEIKVQTKTLGTLGYMAPEYGSEGIVSTMADVYSYGILLMEIFTGKKPTDDKFTGDLSMKKWVSESLPDEVMEIIDPKLLRMINEEELDAKSNCFRLAMTLALECTQDFPENRIDMINVLARLRKIQPQFH
ncbi:Receptor kinase-like protein Xa21 [Sesamum alatum]|uniref:non-specific serine/threonine protein kinase n=1 Tax=Sesamum alatum TaxID=300844 RepID=A0AAE1YKP2_9LAMI|nr:Receptor kinase-like protein Xa21 [Sesamum alatum]